MPQLRSSWDFVLCAIATVAALIPAASSAATLRAQARDRNSAASPDQRYDTLTHLQKPANPNAFWDIAVPNGTYTVRVVAGDPDYVDSVYRLNVEGTPTVAGTPTASTRWFEATSTVTVTDGKLTITNGPGSANNKISFVEIS